ncbi:phage regulatory CII family protein [Arcobacter aquimarinus]|uniref:phage regulatory CII family protein n=1 Tax=Arcobacter aquimarinus TaxID=1315211 RepID=UPI003BB20B70
MKENRRSNARVFDQGLLVTIQKSIIKDIKRNDSTKEDFASEIGITKGTLENKWTFSNKINDFTIHELIHIMELTGDTSPLEYIGHMFDMAVISTNTENVTSVEELNRLTDEAQIQSGESFATVKNASKDGVYTAEEIEDMKKESLEAIEAEQRKLDAINKLVPVELED